MNEINSNYVPARNTGDEPTGSKTRPSRISALHARFTSVLSTISARTANPLRLVLLPVLIVTAVAVIAYLRLYLLVRRPRGSNLSSRARENVGSFVAQYPFHLYPLLAKAFELAHLQSELPALLKNQERVVEMAIGEGSFSQLIYPPGTEIVAVELSPAHLRTAGSMQHVREAIVGDCMRPPLRDGSFDLLVSNNFLHHVTNKKDVVERWAAIARRAIFNENTTYWASSWVTPFLLRKAGLKTQSSKASARIEEVHWQCLRDRHELDSVAASSHDIVRSVSYLNERTFFFCAVFSFLMRCTGPPTPHILKQLFLGPLRRIAIPLTAAIAKLLIQYDELQDRSKDVFVSYTCQSKAWVPSSDRSHLKCPECGGMLTVEDACEKCGLAYAKTDGMLFLLPRELDHIRVNYNPQWAATVSTRELL